MRRVLVGSLLVAALLTAGGCGTTTSARPARAQVVDLGWHENCGTRANPIPIDTHRLRTRKGGWRVDLSFRNETKTTLSIIRPHVSGGTYFGLEPFETSAWREVIERAEKNAAKPGTLADHFSPSLPRLLSPGEGWSGSFSGPGALPAETPIRVVLGRFVILGDVPRGLFDGFLCISERVVRLKGARDARLHDPT